MQPELAYVLHTRPFRETSLLVDLFTRSYGRVSAVSRGSRGKKRAIKLNAYSQILVSWTGKSNLKTLTQIEHSSAPMSLKGDSLFCGFYLNELLMRLLAENDPHQVIYDNYINVLTDLAKNISLSESLRTFEFSLLEELGYGLNLTTDAVFNEPINRDNEYYFVPDLGFLSKNNNTVTNTSSELFKGCDLIAFKDGDFSLSPQAAKKLMRLALEPHIGEKPILSRSFFSKNKLSKNN
jgi:DNA repair protein RecO (recombination protein O)